LSGGGTPTTPRDHTLGFAGALPPSADQSLQNPLVGMALYPIQYRLEVETSGSWPCTRFSTA
jgi:hypothetical protein